MDVANSASDSWRPGPPSVISLSHYGERIWDICGWDTFDCQAHGHVLKELINYIMSGECVDIPFLIFMDK